MASLFALLSGYDLGPGDVVHVDTGTYRLLRNITVSANDAGVRIEGPTSAVALFDRGSNATNAEAIEINGAPGVTVDHVSVTGAYTGISVGAGSNNVVVSNNTVHANDNRGIFIDAGVDAATVSGNTLYGVSGVESTNQNTGIWVVGTHALVTGNVVHDSAGQGIQFDAQPDQVL